MSVITEFQIHHRTNWFKTVFVVKHQIEWNLKSHTICNLHIYLPVIVPFFFFFFSRMLFVGLCLGVRYVLMLGCTCLREKCSKCVLNLSGTEYLKNLQPDWINAGNQSNYTESECLRKQWLPSSSHYLFSLSLCLIHHVELLTRRIHKDCILVCMLCILNSILD